MFGWNIKAFAYCTCLSCGQTLFVQQSSLYNKSYCGLLFTSECKALLKACLMCLYYMPEWTRSMGLDPGCCVTRFRSSLSLQVNRSLLIIHSAMVLQYHCTIRGAHQPPELVVPYLVLQCALISRLDL